MFGVVGIAIWMFAGISWIEDSLTIARLLFHGTLGAVFWLLAGLAFAQPGEGMGSMIRVLGTICAVIWVVPSLTFVFSDSMAVDAHLRLWSLLYLGGLISVVYTHRHGRHQRSA